MMRPGKITTYLACLALAAAGLAAAPATADAASATHTTAITSQLEVAQPDIIFPGNDGRAHQVGWDQHALKIDGESIPITSGEFHYWRLPSPDHWRDVFQKMRAAGFNAVSLYFYWGYHSQERGHYDFSGIRDIDRLLTEAKNAGLYVIARPGPYIQAESSMGGLPNYMTTYPGIPRTASAQTLAADLEWLSAVDQIIKRHQITDGGGSVIAHQIENEMISPFTVEYMRTLSQAVKANGITVPLFHNDYSPGHGFFAPGKPGAEHLSLYAWDYYPIWFNCAAKRGKLDTNFEKRVRSYSPKTPVFIAEGQGGAFTGWGAKFTPEKCAQFVDSDFVRQYSVNNLANGVTMHNTYMEYGGTNWGWTGDPHSGFTSYDYGAAIKEDRTLRPKFAVQKQFNYFQHALPQLLQSMPKDSAKVTVESGSKDILANWRHSPAADGPKLLTIRHRDSNNESRTRLALTAFPQHHSYDRIPQDRATSITLNGRDALALPFDVQVAGQHLVYTTGQLSAATESNGAANATVVISAASGESTETVFKLPSEPQVTGSDAISSTWDEQRSELRLNTTHRAEAAVKIEVAGKTFQFLTITDEQLPTLWLARYNAGENSAELVTTGASLVRSAKLDGNTLNLTGDSKAQQTLRIYGSAAPQVVWNGKRLPTRLHNGVLMAKLPAPVPVTEPVLAPWIARDAAPESAPDFDDSTWTTADKKWVPNLVHGPGTIQQVTLDSDEYGFGDGDVWYRGHFTPKTGSTTITVNSRPGERGLTMVWVNGKFIGSHGEGPHVYPLKWRDVQVGKPNVVTILVRNNGHFQEPLAIGISKTGRGLWDVAFPGAGKITWKIQGNEGGARVSDTARGYHNNGGLIGERLGWHLPGAPIDGFEAVDNLKSQRPGVTWYRSSFDLSLPAGQDTHLELAVNDRSFRTTKYRALLFVNGWLVGNYINNVGPQQSFVIPSGMLNPSGRNEVSVAITAQESGVGPDSLQVRITGAERGGVPWQQNPAPRYHQRHP